MSPWQPPAADARFVGSIPDAYDRYLGPLLFEEYATDLAARVRLPGGSGGDVLEVAAGTGILSRHLRARLPRAVSLTVTDLNAPMLALAERGMRAAGQTANVEWRVADAVSLPFGEGSFDAAVCQFGIMFFPDKLRAAREAFRTLRPGGQWLFNVWGSWNDNPFAPVVHDAIASFFPNDPPEFYRTPFGFHDPDALRALTLTAGFLTPDITTLDRTLEAHSAADAAIGFVRGNPVLTAIQASGTADPETIVAAVAQALVRAFGDKPLRLSSRIHVMSANRPG